MKDSGWEHNYIGKFIEESDFDKYVSEDTGVLTYLYTNASEVFGRYVKILYLNKKYIAQINGMEFVIKPEWIQENTKMEIKEAKEKLPYLFI